MVERLNSLECFHCWGKVLSRGVLTAPGQIESDVVQKVYAERQWIWTKAFLGLLQAYSNTISIDLPSISFVELEGRNMTAAKYASYRYVCVCMHLYIGVHKTDLPQA